MIILNRDEAQQVLDKLEVFKVKEAIELLRAKLHEYPRNQVMPHEFIAAATGKENLIGMPIIWAEWPMREER